MSEGIFIGGSRPKSKKAVKEAIASDPESVLVEITSVFDPHCGGNRKLDEFPIGKRIDFVGPDPYTTRNFYGSITRTGENVWKVQ